MGLSNLLAAVKSRLPSTIPVFVGEKFLSQEDAPPRIVFVPVRGQYGSASGQGGDGIGNPRPLKSRKIAVDVHCWGVSSGAPDGIGELDGAEQLEALVMNAVHDTAAGSYQADSSDYEFEGGSVSQSGTLIVMHLQFFSPICRPADAEAMVLTVPQYTGLQASAEGS